MAAAGGRSTMRCGAALERQQLRVAQFVESLIVRRGTGMPGSMHASFMQAYRGELAEEKAANEALAKAQNEQEAARKRWIDAHLQVKLVDKLRKRARERSQTELLHCEHRHLADRQPRGGLFSES